MADTPMTVAASIGSLPRRDRPTPRRIREVALDLFDRQGYERTSLREIAERLGFTKAALYYHYRSKEDLLVALLEPLLNDLEALATTHTAKPHRGPADLQAFLGDYVEVLLRHRRLLSYVGNDAAAVANSPAGQRFADLDAAIQDWLTGSEASLDARTRCLSVMWGLRSALVRMATEGEDELRQALLSTGCGTLGVRPRRRRAAG